MVDSDGKAIAERDGGTFTFQAASNDQFGIVKGQQNNSAETWHLVNFINGLGHINRQALVDFIDTQIRNNGGGGNGGGITYQDIMRILGDIRLFGPDDLPIATNTGGHLTLQQATPQQYGVCKPRKNSPCYPQKTSWQTMDGVLEAQTKHDVHMFAPFSFPKEMPKRMEFFDRLTFIPINAREKCCTERSFDPERDFAQDFEINVFDPTKDFTQDFEIEARDYINRCPLGTVWNPDTRQCEYSCPPGQFYNALTGQCESPTGPPDNVRICRAFVVVYYDRALSPGHTCNRAMFDFDVHGEILQVNLNNSGQGTRPQDSKIHTTDMAV